MLTSAHNNDGKNQLNTNCAKYKSTKKTISLCEEFQYQSETNLVKRGYLSGK